MSGSANKSAYIDLTDDSPESRNTNKNVYESIGQSVSSTLR